MMICAICGHRIVALVDVLSAKICGRCWRRCRRRSQASRSKTTSTSRRSTAFAPSSKCLPGPSKAAVRLWSRNGNEKTAQFPDIVEAIGTWLKAITAPIVLDGEVVALDEEGRPASFQRIQHRIHVTVPGFNSRKKILSPEEQPVAFIAFDLLRDGDRDLRNLCLYERREFLEALFKKHKAPKSELVRLTPQSIGDGTALKKRAESENWEGLMVKLSRSPYRTAKRSPEWMKYKLTKQDEFVVCGYTDPGGTRQHFGSLILGAHDNGRLRYAGEVGTGFKGAELDRIMRLLKRIETPDEPVRSDAEVALGEGETALGETAARRAGPLYRDHRRRPLATSCLSGPAR